MSRPIAIAALSLMLGIGTAHGVYHACPATLCHVLPMLCWAGLLLMSGIAAWCFHREKGLLMHTWHSTLFAVLTFLFFFVMGAGRMVEQQNDMQVSWPQQAMTVSGAVSTVPTDRGSHTSFTLTTYPPPVATHPADAVEAW